MKVALQGVLKASPGAVVFSGVTPFQLIVEDVRKKDARTPEKPGMRRVASSRFQV